MQRRVSNKRLFLLITAVILIAASLSYKVYAYSRRLSFETAPQPQIVKASSIRITNLYIKSLDVNRPVSESRIINNVWETSDDGISHLSTSANPHDGGNIIMYGHNKREILGSLPSIKKDDLITLVDQNTVEYHYKVTETHIVDPSDVSVLETTGGEELTLYTCYGFADSKRFVVKAKRI